MISTGLARDHVLGRQASTPYGLRGYRREPSAEVDQAVDGQHADASAVGQDSDALPLQSVPPASVSAAANNSSKSVTRGSPARRKAAHRQRRIPPKHPVRQGGARSLAVTSRLDDDNGFHARGGASRREKLTSVGNRFDVKKDRIGSTIEREVIDAIAEIDVDLVAERNDAGEADLIVVGPFNERRDDRARLRNDGEIARARGLGEEVRRDLRAVRDADAIGSDDAQAASAGDASQVFGQRTLAMAKSGRDDDRHRRADRAGLFRDFDDAFGGNGDDDKIGRRRAVRQALATFQSVDLGMSGIDEQRWARWISASQIGEHSMAEGARARARAHQGDGSRGKQLVQTIVAHRLMSSRDARKVSHNGTVET